MVAQEEAPQSTQQQENTGTFGKLKQTLSSSLLTAQDRGEKANNNNLSLFEFFDKPNIYVDWVFFFW